MRYKLFKKFIEEKFLKQEKIIRWVALFIQLLTAFAMISTVIISNKTLGEQRRFNVTTLRPHLLLEAVEKNVIVDDDSNLIKFSIQIKNYGATPAYDIAIDGRLFYSDENLNSIYNYFKERQPLNETKQFLPQNRDFVYHSTIDLGEDSSMNRKIDYLSDSIATFFTNIKYSDQSGNIFGFIAKWGVKLIEVENGTGRMEFSYIDAMSY